MQRVTGLPDEQVLAYEAQAEAALRAALEHVMDIIARRVEAAMPVLAAALVAADQGDIIPPSDVPAGDGLPPGQPYVSPDDLASIPPLWEQAVAQQVLPIVAQVFLDAAGRTHANMIDASSIAGLPSVGSLAAEQYLAQVSSTFDQIGDDLWATARTELSDGFARGESIPQLADRLRASAGVTARTGVLVARTQVNEASNAGSFAVAQASGLQMQKEWIATPDLRTRPTHLAADGQRVDLNEPFIVGGYSALFPAAPSLPPAERYNCFPGDTPVLAGSVVRAYRRWFDGELVEVVDREGRETSGTENHPVLTDRGWIALGELVQGDKLVTYRVDADAVPGHDVDAGPATIGEMFDALASVGTLVRIGRLAVDFHGDRPQGDVEVVAVDGKLRNGMQPGVDQGIEDFLLPPSDEGPRLLSADGGLGQCLGTPSGSSDRVMGGLAESGTLLGSRSRHAGEHRLTAPPGGDTSLEQPASERWSTDAGFESQRLLGFAGEIALQEVVGIRRVPWSGHVYNLETSTGAYVAGYTNMVVQNCRCTIGYVMPDKAPAQVRQDDLQTQQLEDLPGTTTIDDLATAQHARLQQIIDEQHAAVEQVIQDVHQQFRDRFGKAGGPGLGDLGPEAMVDPRAIRATFRQAKTTDELRAVWQDEMRAVTGRDIIVQMPPGASVLTMRQYAEGVTQMLERFPEARLRKISWWSDGTAADYARIARGSATIEFNAYWAADVHRAEYLRALRSDVSGWSSPTRSGWSVRGGSTPQATAYHEFAHILDIETLSDGAKARALAIVRRRAVLRGVADDELTATEISAYAGSNGNELIAEAMTDVMVNGPRASAVSREIYDLIVADYRARGLAVRTTTHVADEFGDLFPKQAATGGLGAKTVAQLRALAKERGIIVPAGARKADLVKALSEPTPSVLDEKALLRAAARDRNRLIESSQGTARLLADVDELIASKATKAALRQRLDPALLGPEQLYAGADPALVDALRKALDTGDPTKLRAALTRATTRAKLKPVSKAGAKTTFDAETMEGVGGIDIPVGAQVTVVRRGATLTLPDGSTMQLTRAQVTPVAPKPVKAVKAAPRVGLEPITPFQALDITTRRFDRALTDEAALVSPPYSHPKALNDAYSDLIPDAATRHMADVGFRSYGGQGYEPINALLRNGDSLVGDGKYQEMVRAMDVAMDASPLPADIITWRSTTTGRSVFGDALSSDLTGFTWDESGYISTSTRRSGAEKAYAGKILMRILVPRGTGAVQQSTWEWEAEMLLQRGLKLRVVADRGLTERGARLLDVEVVPKPVKAAPVRAPVKRAPRAAKAPPGELETRVKGGVAQVEPLAGGKNATTELVTFTDGGQGVRKTARAVEGRAARLQQDAEELGAQMLQRFGIRAPRTYRASPRVIYQDVVEGRVAAELPRVPGSFDIAGPYYASDEGRVLGLVDALMDNYDRNAGNWLVGVDGSLGGIDHGFAFQWGGKFGRPSVAPFSESNAFSRHLSKPYPNKGEWADNDYSPADIATARRILADLRPEFVRLGHVDWHDKAVERLGFIEEHATGTRVRIKPPPLVKAVARQAAIDEARQVGDLAAEVLELSNHGASVAALRSRISATAARLGTPDEVRDALLEVTSRTGDVLQAQALQQLERAGITPIGTAGQVVKFDRRIHDPIAGVKAGDLVVVDRPGLTFTRDGEKIQLAKAKVGPAPKPPKPIAPAGASMADREVALRKVAKAPVKGERTLGSGTQGDVKLVTTTDGEYVDKQLAGYIKAKDLQAIRDGEELGPLVLDTFGLRGPASYSSGARGVVSEFMEGKTGAELFPGVHSATDAAGFEAIAASDEGRLMGLADYIMGNADRNSGNWLRQASGRLAGIDHGYAFQLDGFRDVTITPAGDFGEWLQAADRRHLTDTVDVDPRDLAIVRARLEALRPRFTEASRSAWFNTMMRRLAELEKRAVGTTPRIFP